MTPATYGTSSGLKSYKWRSSYKTSITLIDGRPLDMLHDFYIPALKRAVRYDRVAGYFRSTSLAAASQGYSQLVNQGGEIRMIVGSDLEPEDVSAALAGDLARLEKHLCKELDGAEQWPEAVQNGMALLAWMIANRRMQLKVAFRISGITGKPIAFDSVEDGYVHEKWLILEDSDKHRMYVSGTLNESKTGLVYNAENVDIHCDWWGEREVERIQEADEGFEALWENKMPHMTVLDLPEAVKQKLIQCAEQFPVLKEIDGTKVQQEILPPDDFERLRWAIISDAPKMPGGRFVGLETAPVEPWPHQNFVVRKLVETYPYAYMLCDEVGLGKTIEAALAMRSLYLSGMVRRILVSAPAGLTRQWHRQLASKVLMPFGLYTTGVNPGHEYIFPMEEKVPGEDLFSKDLVIVSNGLMLRKERAKALESNAPFDIVLIDEAHALRRRNTTEGVTGAADYGLLYQNAQDYLRPKSKAFWMATATPMQLEPVEVSDLIRFTDRVGAFQQDPTLTWLFYQTLQEVLSRQAVSEEELEFLVAAINAVEVQDPMLWDHLHKYVIDPAGRASLRAFLEERRLPANDLNLRRLSRFSFSAAPLSRVMMRHTRSLLEVYREKGKLKGNLARRYAAPRVVKFTEVEQLVYDLLEAYCVELQHQLTQGNENATNRQMVSFLLSFLRVRFASSFYAIQQTLIRRKAKVDATLQQKGFGRVEMDSAEMRSQLFDGEEEEDTIDENLLLQNRTIGDLKWETARLESILEEMTHLPMLSSKMKEFLTVINNRKGEDCRVQQTVVFTRFYDTLQDILRNLQRAQRLLRVGTYSGQTCSWFNPSTQKVETVSREAVKELFLRGEIDILLCTDAAAEGLNLQTADLLINYDLGWNPMKIEQRIGRIDRIGQKHNEIHVLNFCYADSVEEIIYSRLQSRLANILTMVGSQQVSIVPVTPEEFEQLANRDITEEQLENIIRERVDMIRKKSELLELKPLDLYEVYERMDAAYRQNVVPVNLEQLWETLDGSKYLSQFKIERPVSDEPVLIINDIPGVMHRGALTASRDLYENGLAHVGNLHFSSYGDPFFDSLVEHILEYELPECVQRVSVPLEGICPEYVGYGALARNADGSITKKLLISIGDLEGLCLDLGEKLEPEDIAALEWELRLKASEEFQLNAQ